MKILVVEDSVRLADSISEALKKENHVSDIVHNGKNACDAVMNHIYDLIILDLMLPGMSGYEVLERIRKEGCRVPVIILSARTELEDKVAGFERGADDYVTKPFEIRELLLRIQAIARRSGAGDIRSLSMGNMELDYRRGEIVNRDSGKRMQISGKELRLLELFLRNKNQTLEKEQILVRIWGYETDAEYNNVEVYVSFLRRKMKLMQMDVAITTVRGIGYRLEKKD